MPPTGSPPKQNKAYYVKKWKTHGIVQCQRGDQLGEGKTELFLDPEKKVRIVGKVGEWFVNPELAVRAVELRRGREIRSLQRRIAKVKAIEVAIRGW
jgi:hypothetical protein